MNNTETRVCRKCQQPYEAQYWDIGGMLKTKILRGDGYCVTCAKQVYDEEVAKEEAARLAEIAGIRRKRRESSRIPPKFKDSDFSTFEKGWQDNAYQRCWDYAAGFPIDKRPIGYRSLYLWSTESWGTGKTHLASAICHRIYDRWDGKGNKACPRIIFLSEPELFRRIQATYSFTREESQLRESEDDIIKSIVYADLVVLDDVGKEPRKDMQFVRKTLFAIINGRYDQKLPMIITANLKPEQLNKHLDGTGEASFGRFYDEMCGGKSTRMDGKSYRRKDGH